MANKPKLVIQDQSKDYENFLKADPKRQISAKEGMTRDKAPIPLHPNSPNRRQRLILNCPKYPSADSHSAKFYNLKREHFLQNAGFSSTLKPQINDETLHDLKNAEHGTQRKGSSQERATLDILNSNNAASTKKSKKKRIVIRK
uniref:Uncharacterized protein n=1 Tax=Euplotes crassus TaxID=5936 RepID=A0A7S3KKN2_EUPCR|mmetsp:Transcript_32338/g.31740  ORF Transcript_32338/g.31740 Transcript_32338/m.31740 type:complete len:144 (+) Transcript_32338:86-517(+)